MTPKDSAKLPLEMVAQYTKKYPGVWDAAQEMREWVAKKARRIACSIKLQM